MWGERDLSVLARFENRLTAETNQMRRMIRDLAPPQTSGTTIAPAAAAITATVPQPSQRIGARAV